MRRNFQKVLASVLVILVLTSSGAALGRPAQRTTAKTPIDPLTYQVARTNESWAMQDGVKLPGSVFSPADRQAGEVFPMVVFTHAWMMDKSMFESAAIKYAGRGYVSVTYSVRGWGGAEGDVSCAGPEREMKDLSRIITLVSQDARFPVLKDSRGPVVGVTGYSLGGLTAYLIAPRLNPRPGDPGDPRVRAVVPMHGTTDLLFSLVPNGAGKAFWAALLLGGSYFGNLTAAATNVLRVLADNNLSPFEKIISALNTLMTLTVPINHVSDEMARVLGIALQRSVAEMDQLKRFLNVRSAAWWCDQERDGAVEHPITVPTLMTTSWNDDLFCPNEPLGAFNAMVAAPKRIIVSSGGHAGGYFMPVPGVQPQADPEKELIERESAEWFDHFLKGIENGVEREPAVSYFRDWDPRNYGTSAGWPLAGTRDVTYFPGVGTGFREGSLAVSAAVGSPSDTLINFGFSGSISLPYFNDMFKMVGVNQTVDIPEKVDLINMPFQRYSYVTKPLDSDLLIDGTPRLAVTYQCSSQFAQLIPRLYEIAPDGKQTLISRGWFEGYSEKIWTRLNNGDRPFEMMTCCHKVKAGSRLKLEIQTSDLLQSWPVWGLSLISIFHDGPGATRLMLPVAPGN